MGVFDNLRNQPIIKQPVIKAEKTLKKVYLYGCISNGDALIRLDKEYGIKVIAIDNEYVTLILLDYGKEIEMKKQGWQKTKEIKKVNSKINIDNTEEEKSLF